MSTKISLKAARVNANLTLINAAKQLGIGKDTLIKWEKNPDRVQPRYQKIISEVYSMPIDNIFFGI
ncbi:MAG: helix-turn-helix transcriptional regulator [Veillonellaceae bacterium]|nr:helix-turn-helix transcriptional regulator [Veillonellaceae bacterium]MDY4485555.1 helix-turn-helix transcriptional regulator [Anaerovibrio sp.]MDY5330165.1 helix-turn-helix transcriptional regulator [Anaerovibrio sp.]